MFPTLPRVAQDWKPLFDAEFDRDYFHELQRFVDGERREHRVYPPADRVFSAFDATALAATKVVIVGQDPYHGPGQAHGLAFSVPDGVAVPPSLRNILRELSDDLGLEPTARGDLTPWARQGVLLLNSTLTVRDGEPLSHAGRGWETFTDRVIEHVSRTRDMCVFVLWGKTAQRATRLIDARHRIVAAAHPSPLSAHRGFFGSRPFSTINKHLEEAGLDPIDWSIS